MRTKLDNQSTYITASRNTQLHLRQQHSEVSRASTKHDNRLHNTKHRSRFFFILSRRNKNAGFDVLANRVLWSVAETGWSLYQAVAPAPRFLNRQYRTRCLCCAQTATRRKIRNSVSRAASRLRLKLNFFLLFFRLLPRTRGISPWCITITTRHSREGTRFFFCRSQQRWRACRNKYIHDARNFFFTRWKLWKSISHFAIAIGSDFQSGYTIRQTIDGCLMLIQNLENWRNLDQ